MFTRVINDISCKVRDNIPCKFFGVQFAACRCCVKKLQFPIVMCLIKPIAYGKGKPFITQGYIVWLLLKISPIRSRRADKLHCVSSLFFESVICPPVLSCCVSCAAVFICILASHVLYAYPSYRYVVVFFSFIYVIVAYFLHKMC